MTSLWLTSVPSQAREVVHSTAKGLFMGFGAAGGAVALALISLFRTRFPETGQRALRTTLAPVLNGIRKVHSGHVGDYIVWLVIGVVALGVGFALGNTLR